MSQNKRSLSKEMIETKSPSQAPTNIQQNLSRPHLKLLSPNSSKKIAHFKSKAPFGFIPIQLLLSGEQGHKPLSKFKQHFKSNATCNNNEGRNEHKETKSISKNKSTSNFFQGHTIISQYKLFNDNQNFLIKPSKCTQGLSITNNLSSNASAIKISATQSTANLDVKKKFNIITPVIKSIKSAVNIESNANLIKTSDRNSKDPSGTILHHNTNSIMIEGLFPGMINSVLTSTDSNEFAVFSSNKGESNSNDTRENTCSSTSTIKLNQKVTLEKPSSKTERTRNIENPEDLHIFYVSMIQSNKEYNSKFDKDD